MGISLTLNDFATLVGLVAGTAGIVLGILNYLRDRPKVAVELEWDLSKSNTETSGKLWGVIRVANVGRRPVYVSHVAIRLPKGYDDSHLLVMEGIKGDKLEEGSEPLVYLVDQARLEQYAAAWRDMRAQVTDHTGSVWRSPKKKKTASPPSWARKVTS